MEFNTDIFAQFDKKWALLSAGPKEDHCRKIFWQDMTTMHMPPEIVSEHYTPDEPHTLYIGEIVDVFRN